MYLTLESNTFIRFPRDWIIWMGMIVGFALFAELRARMVYAGGHISGGHYSSTTSALTPRLHE